MLTRSISLARGAHGLLLGFPVALFSLGLATDITYLRTEELQWSNFSSWAIVGALVFGAVVVLWSLIDLIRVGGRWHLVYSLLLLTACVLGLVNAFKHSQDGWSSVGTLGVTLSALCCLLALVAGLVRYSGALDEGDAR
ncbi:DUF2231 domain-containing protein [Brevundimonas vesicularis]|uniref:DUF2231 domain-containing protein n=1 Tax=Brevundimonas vesicularis TaxID=41276 RepID=UPI0038D37719